MPGDFEAAGAAIVRETRNAVRLTPYLNDSDTDNVQPCQLRAVLRSPIHVIVLTVALGATTILLIIIIVWLAVLHAYTKALDLGLTTLRVAYSAPSELSPCSQDAATQTEATLPAISVIEPEPAIESTQAEQSHIEEVAEHPAPLQSETKASEVDQATEKAVSTNAWDSEQVTLRDNSIRQINKLIQQPQRPGPASELTNKGFNAANLEEARAFMQTATRGGQKSTRKGPKPAAQQNSIPKAKQYSQLAHGPKAWIAPPKKLDTFTTATENSTPRPKATVQKTTVRSRFTEPALTLSNAAAESMHSLPQETQSLATEDRPVSPESTTRVPPSCSDIKTGEFTIAKLKDINPKKHGPGLQCQICLRWSTNVVKLRDNDAIDVCSACQAVVDRIHDANRVIDEPDFYISETTRDQGGSLLPNKQHAASGPSTAKSTSTYTSNGDIIIGHIPETPPGYAGANSAQRTPVKSHSSTGNTRADATLSPLTSQEQLVDLEGDLGGAGSTLTREIPEPLSDSLSSLLDLEDHSTTHEQPMRPVHNNQTRSSSLSAASAPFAPSRSSSGSSGVSPLNLPAPLVEYESRVRYLPDPFVPKHGNALKTVPQIHLTAPGPKPPVFYSQNPRCEPSQPSIAPALGSGEFNTIVFDFGAPTALHALPSTSIAEAYYQDNPAHVRTAIPQHWREDQNADHSQPWGSNYPPTQSYEDIAPPPGLRMPGHLRQALRPGSRSEAIPIVSPAQACGLTDTALRHTHHSTSLSKAIPIVKPPQAVEPKEYYNGKQSIVKSSCDVAAARSSDPDSVPASSEQQQQEQQVQHRSADEPESIETFSKPFEKPDSEHHTDAILADNVPAESNEAHDEDQGEHDRITSSKS